MAKITTVKTTGMKRVLMTRQELRTITIALALLSVEDMEKEMEEQNLNRKDVTYDHLALFKDFTDETGLYPFKEVIDMQKESENGNE